MITDHKTYLKKNMRKRYSKYPKIFTMGQMQEKDWGIELSVTCVTKGKRLSLLHGSEYCEPACDLTASAEVSKILPLSQQTRYQRRLSKLIVQLCGCCSTKLEAFC